MDRSIVYEGQLPRTLDVLQSQKNAYVAVSKLIEAMVGLNSSAFGLTCVPTGPASLNVVVNPGQLYQVAQLDTSAYSTIGTDSHTILKQGLLLDTITLSCPAPAASGFSINYLIQGKVTESDANTILLPYFNSSNINTPLSGPSDSGVSQATLRQDAITIAIKNGVAATTGTQTTPSVDSGYVPLFVIAVAHSQTTITSGNISVHSSAPFVVNATSTNINSFFPNQQSASGFQKLPGGIILQWGIRTASLNANTSVTEVLTFPNACLNVQLTPMSTGSTSSIQFKVSSFNADHFTVTNQDTSYAGIYNWFAIGY